MPERMYSFQVVVAGNQLLVGQWDGIYRKAAGANWVKWNNGLPHDIAITELRGNERVLLAAWSGWWVE